MQSNFRVNNSRRYERIGNQSRRLNKQSKKIKKSQRHKPEAVHRLLVTNRDSILPHLREPVSPPSVPQLPEAPRRQPINYTDLILQPPPLPGAPGFSILQFSPPRDWMEEDVEPSFARSPSNSSTLRFSFPRFRMREDVEPSNSSALRLSPPRRTWRNVQLSPPRASPISPLLSGRRLGWSSNWVDIELSTPGFSSLDGHHRVSPLREGMAIAYLRILGTYYANLVSHEQTDSLFSLPQTIRLTKENTFYDLFEMIKNNPDTSFNIELVDGDDIAVGDGASRQFYLKCFAQIIELGAFVIEGCRADVNPTNGFWEDEDNISCLIELFKLIVKDGVLPYHLSPCLLSKMIHKPLTDLEYEFFVDKKDPQLLSRLSAPGAEEIITEELGYENKRDYYVFLLDKNYHRSSPHRDLTRTIYNKLAQVSMSFDFFDGALNLDEHLSGPYDITPRTVYKMTKLEFPLWHIENDTHYQNLWKEFIYSLTETELKNMLLTFTNSLSINQQILIRVDDINQDMKIQTCMKLVTLNKKLFHDLSTLQNLKYLFTNDDNISDFKMPTLNRTRPTSHSTGPAIWNLHRDTILRQ